jgi:tetratricopeptide (TPR) repeat protein
VAARGYFGLKGTFVTQRWAVRVHGRGRVVGAGMLLPDRHVLTCAHVVNAALGRSDGATEVPDQAVEVQFPGLGTRAYQAVVVEDGWHRVEADQSGDAAVLRLVDDPPSGAEDAVFAPASIRSTDVHCYGYPAGFDTGVEAQAFLAGETPGTQWVQLEARAATGRRIERGFSGAGVVADRSGAVLGMVMLADRDQSTKVAWMLPFATIMGLLASPLRDKIRRHAASPAGPDNLPAVLSDFTGRRDEVEMLAGRIATSGSSLAIHAIDGMGGIGKTSLAVYLAHRLADRYPDGRLFIDFQAHSADNEPPLEAAQAISRLLRLLKATPSSPPPDNAGWSDVWRAELSKRRVLVVLDNAASTAQIEHMIPGSASSLVLITSRRRLDGLRTRGVSNYSLDVLTQQDAVDLFATVVGTGRADAERAAVVEIVELCGRLPLAVRLVAARLAARPAWAVSDIVDDLRDERTRLATMQVENISVRAAFDLSYRTLSDEEKLAFRRLGLHPPGALGLPVALALVGIGRTPGRDVLERLVDYSLVREPERHRYRLHDLMREFARECARESDPYSQRKLAVSRALDYYLYVALAAHATLMPQRPIRDEVAEPPALTPTFDSAQAAIAWYSQESVNLLSCRGMALEYDLQSYLWRIPRAIAHYLGLLTNLADAGNNYGLGLSLASIANDRQAVADMSARIGEISHAQGNHAEAIRSFRGARENYLRLGDKIAAADMLNRIGVCFRMNGTNDLALTEHRRALAEHTALEDVFGQAESHYMIAMVLRVQGSYPDALAHHEKAIELYRTLNYTLGEARSLANIGVIHRLRKDYDAALTYYPRALQIYRGTGDQRGIANTLNNMASALDLVGRTPEAFPLLREATEIFTSIGNPGGTADVMRVTARLKAEMGNFATAETELRAALNIYEINQAVFGIGGVLTQLASVLRRAGQPQEALELAEQSLRVYRTEVSSKSGEVGALLEIAHCRLALDERRTAHGFAAQALSLSDDLGANNQREIRELLDSLVEDGPDGETRDAAG